MNSLLMMAMIFFFNFLCTITHVIRDRHRGLGAFLLLQPNNQRQRTTKSIYCKTSSGNSVRGMVLWETWEEVGLDSTGLIRPLYSSSIPGCPSALPGHQSITALIRFSCSCYLLFNGLFLVFRDLQRIGVSLAGHQKKILTSVQLMRHNVDDQSPTESV